MSNIYRSIPPLKISQTICTASQCLAMGLPAALDKVGKFLELDARKDAAGKRIMMKLSKPPKEGKTHPVEAFEMLYEYCKTDVRVERELENVTVPLSDFERGVWLLDQKINSQGIRVDIALSEKAVAVVEAEKTHIKLELNTLTGGLVTSPAQVAALTKWLSDIDARIKGLNKSNLTEYLAFDDLDTRVRRALELRKDFSKSSTSKIKRLLKCVNTDARVRGSFLYHGAHTGRWAGKGVQLQNLPKSIFKEDKDLDYVFELLESERSPEEVRQGLADAYGDVLGAISSIVRGLFIADKDSTLVCADYSNVEGRVLAWLAGERWKLEAFEDFDSGKGLDLYIKEYAQTFNLAPEWVTKAQRQIGKVLSLAFGFGGGVGAWEKMSAMYPDVPKFSGAEIDEYKCKWRASNKAITALWKKLEWASIQAVKHPGKVFNGGKAIPILFKMPSTYLVCKLPSGRNMFYPKARLEEGMYGPMMVFESVKGASGKVKETYSYGGFLSENVTQAVARDLMAAAMVALDALGYKIAGSVHDEIITNVRHDEYETKSLEVLKKVMCQLPEWATGLPLAAAGWTGFRFRKD